MILGSQPLAETESTLWAEAQVLNTQREVTQMVAASLPSIPGYGVLQMVLGKTMIIFRDKVGIVLYKVLMA